MDIKDILSVGLTTEDFDLILQGLDAIPESELHKECVQGMTIALFAARGGKAAQDEAMRLFDRNMKDTQKKVDAKKEDMVILKSKLIQLKRLLAGNEAVRMTQDILAGGG